MTGESTEQKLLSFTADKLVAEPGDRLANAQLLFCAAASIRATGWDRTTVLACPLRPEQDADW